MIDDELDDGGDPQVVAAIGAAVSSDCDEVKHSARSRVL